MNNTFFCSDHHFGHSNIIKYCNRPWADRDEMREGLIDKWNSVVGKGDRVYVLGDFSFYKKAEPTLDILRRLNGQKFLLAGNHDYSKYNWEGHPYSFVWVRYQKHITVNDQKILMTHYPQRSWAGNNRGTWGLHGHLHSANPYAEAQKWAKCGRSFDVGVDGHGYLPWEFEELKVLLDKIELPDYRHTEMEGESK